MRYYSTKETLMGSREARGRRNWTIVFALLAAPGALLAPLAVAIGAVTWWQAALFLIAFAWVVFVHVDDRRLHS